MLYDNNIQGGVSYIGKWMPATLLTKHEYVHGMPPIFSED